MEPDQQMAQDHIYGGGEHWVDMSAYPTTMPEYGQFYHPPNIAPMPLQPSPHGLPSESIGRLPPAPHQPTTMATHQHHPQLPMLNTNMPSHPTWPSMLTNPAGGSYSAPPISMPPIAPEPTLKATKTPGMTRGSQPRRTLTEQERRDMCRYHEENPTKKQAEIAAKFNVERSTVSKVLRHKERYRFPEDRTSPIKRSKGKLPDIERALSNWARNQQKSGKVVTDEQIKEKLNFFAASVGNSENPLKTNSNWLEKFKQKNGIGPGRLARRASEANIPDSVQLASASIAADSPNGSTVISPASPTAGGALSATRSEEDKDSVGNGMFDFTVSNERLGNESATSVNAPTNFSTQSPTTPFTFSPDPNFQRPRSQTFPTLDVEYAQEVKNAEPMTPKYGVPSTAPPSALESPGDGGHQFGIIDSTIQSPPPHQHKLHRSASSSSMTGRAVTPASAGGGSGPSSPTQEDARRAADTLLSFIQNLGSTTGIVDQNDLAAVIRLTEKLRLHAAAQQIQPKIVMGGLTRIPEGDVEVGVVKTEPMVG